MKLNDYLPASSFSTLEAMLDYHGAIDTLIAADMVNNHKPTTYSNDAGLADLLDSFC